MIPTTLDALSDIEWNPSAITLELLTINPITILDIATKKLANKRVSKMFLTFL